VFWKLAIKPGKPFAFAFAKLANSVFLGLSGDLVSAMIKMSGGNKKQILGLNGNQPMRLKNHWAELIFSAVTISLIRKGQLMVESVGLQSSSIFSSMSRSNCFIVLEQNRGNIKKTEQVVTAPYSSLLD